MIAWPPIRIAIIIILALATNADTVSTGELNTPFNIPRYSVAGLGPAGFDACCGAC